MENVVIVDYGMGNLHSVQRACHEASPPDIKISVSNNPKHIAAADRIIFPGQGAAKDCMAHIHKQDLTQSITEAARQKPFLGICMGLQVLMNHSLENGGVDCLGLCQGQALPFDQRAETAGLKIPHMGWNQIQQNPHPLWTDIPDNSRFYFVHSYYVVPNDDASVSGTTEYGIPFAASIAKDNLFAIQAHPEKSAENGLQLIRNFMHWNP